MAKKASSAHNEIDWDTFHFPVRPVSWLSQESDVLPKTPSPSLLTLRSRPEEEEEGDEEEDGEEGEGSWEQASASTDDRWVFLEAHGVLYHMGLRRRIALSDIDSPYKIRRLLAAMGRRPELDPTTCIQALRAAAHHVFHASLREVLQRYGTDGPIPWVETLEYQLPHTPKRRQSKM